MISLYLPLKEEEKYTTDHILKAFRLQPTDFRRRNGQYVGGIQVQGYFKRDTTTKMVVLCEQCLGTRPVARFRPTPGTTRKPSK
jgi:hypothetical protein